MQSTHEVLAWDLCDRLAKSLRVSGMSVAEMAAALGVHRNTIGGYLAGRHNPDRRTLIAWAFACKSPAVTVEWLETGKTPPPNGDGVTGDTSRYRYSGAVASLPRSSARHDTMGLEEMAA